MSSDPYQDADAHHIKRKPPPPFPYSPRYPEPDPSDPFAPLSVLRDRTATLTNSPYELPVTIPDSTSGPSKVLDLATFITHQREKSAALGSLFGGEGGWQGHMSQLRKGTSMGPGLHEYSSGTDFPVAASSTLRPGERETQHREARRRSQSVFALRSGTFSFLEPRPGPESSAERRHSLTPYGSRASVITSSSTSSWASTHGDRKVNKTPPRPRSCSSSFVPATLLDGVSEVPTRKSMRSMQVDTTTSGVEKRSLAESPPPVLPPPLEKRNPSDSSTGSWSRDLVFYSAPSRPLTPSSIRSSRPVSLPPSATLSFPFVSDNLLPTKPALFTTSPVTSSTHNATPIPSNLATPLPPNNSDSHRFPMPEDRDVLPLQLNVRFPRRGQLAESDPESMERESGRFSRLRARTSAALQTRRSSTSSSLRSTLRAATEAADKLAAEDAPVASFPPVAYKRVTQTPVGISVSGSTKARSLATGIPESKELERCQPMGPQIGGGGCGAEQPASTPSTTHTTHQRDMDHIPAIRSAQLPAELKRGSPPKPELKVESESVPLLKRRRASRGLYKGTARRSSSTPLPLSRPLPSPPTITKHPEPMVNLSPMPLPSAHGPGLSHQQVQRYPTAPASLMDGAPQPTSHVIHLTPSASPHISLAADAAQPRVVNATTLAAPRTTSPIPSAQAAYPRPPPPPPLSRSVRGVPVSSSTVHGYASNTMRSTSSNSSHFDNMSTMSAPQLRRRDASPSSSRGWHSSHTSEQLGHNHHPPHPLHHPASRSLPEPGFPGILSFAQLAQAARIPIVRENGVRVQFGELWRMQRTVAIFIRHFWYTAFFVLQAMLNYYVHHAGALCVKTTSRHSCEMSTTQRSRELAYA